MNLTVLPFMWILKPWILFQMKFPKITVISLGRHCYYHSIIRIVYVVYKYYNNSICPQNTQHSYYMILRSLPQTELHKAIKSRRWCHQETNYLINYCLQSHYPWGIGVNITQDFVHSPNKANQFLKPSKLQLLHSSPSTIRHSTGHVM